MKVTLIRHTSVAVEPGICYGWSDVDVAATFPEEARKVYESIAGDQYDDVYCSPLNRCRKLASFCNYPTPTIDERLIELNFGSWEMQKWDNISDPLLDQWYNDWIHLPAGGAESYENQCRRVASFLDELRHKKRNHTCIFTHRGVIACALVYAGICSVENSFDEDIPYGSKNVINLSY